MKTFKVGDKVKVTGNQSNSAFKLHGKTCTICEVGKNYYGLEEEILLNIDFGGVHHHEVELVSEYNKTFNPEAHSSLITDFGKDNVVKSIENAAKISAGFFTDKDIDDDERYYQSHKCEKYDCFVEGAKSDAARNYWFKIFQEEQNKQ